QFGADVVVSEGQPLGLSPSFGGPLLGLFATRKRYLRQMPGRIAGQTVDTKGKIGYTMAAQTREQHIRRERATSNICTNSALCALAATVYLASLGANGLQEVALLNLEKAHYLARQISSLSGYRLAFQAPFFNEFTVQVPTNPQQLRADLQEGGFLVDNPTQLASLGVADALRFAVTEKRTKEELDHLVKQLGEIR
ncbi:MAG TPA: glycine dehydrogenase, partial [Candidatus Heimdallarchaeota archaeon]|nr:glycine dehydrogenase [Candidatus Heimdallarchaeota archaeon]